MEYPLSGAGPKAAPVQSLRLETIAPPAAS
jgi:hypothetical protein